MWKKIKRFFKKKYTKDELCVIKIQRAYRFHIESKPCIYCYDTHCDIELHCGHKFHRSCIYRSVKNYNYKSCPLCRKPLIMTDYIGIRYVVSYNLYLGSTYTGDFVDYKPHGYGMCNTFSTTYKGQWKKGYRHGIGNYKSKTRMYDGIWKHGMKHGHGTLKRKTDSGSWIVEYDGNWKYNMKWGK